MDLRVLTKSLYKVKYKNFIFLSYPNYIKSPLSLKPSLENSQIFNASPACNFSLKIRKKKSLKYFSLMSIHLSLYIIKVCVCVINSGMRQSIGKKCICTFSLCGLFLNIVFFSNINIYYTKPYHIYVHMCVCYSIYSCCLAN